MNRGIKTIAMALAACATWLFLCAPAAFAAKPKVAVFRFDGPLHERPPGEMLFSFGRKPETLKGVIERFEKAASDDDVRAVLVTFGRPALGLAQLQELRKAIKDVVKPVYVHADELNTGLYLIASATDHLAVTPTGDVWLLGLYSEVPYLRNMLDKLQIEPDIVHIGDYKSAGETLYRTDPSDEARENMDWLLDGIYGAIVDMIAADRFHGDEDKVRAIIDHGLYTAEEALSKGLIDSVCHRQDIVAELKKKYGDDLTFVHRYGSESMPEIDLANPFAVFQLISELLVGGDEKPSKTSIAVVYVDGTIQTGQEEPDPFGESSGAYSTTIRRALDSATDDDTVKAVVLRVDSPGGSALASEIIYDATQRVRKAGKPLVVSMGNVAASGGYYVACGADAIFADPATITASIGVVGGKLVTTGMWNWLGVNWHEYKRGESADIMTTSRTWTEGERKKILDWMEVIYGVFKGHIIEHRGDKLTKDLDKMAGGRVFTGAQALDLGLVDDLGDFDAAVSRAADLAGIADYELRILPKPKTIFDILMEDMGGRETDRVTASARMTSPFLQPGSPSTDVIFQTVSQLDPQRARILLQAVKRLDLIHREGVILMMPTDLLVRFR